jgi:GH35 family endo-1,4-beta-xylanase
MITVKSIFYTTIVSVLMGSLSLTCKKPIDDIPSTRITLKNANPTVKVGALISTNSSTTPTDVSTYKKLITDEFNICQAIWFPGYNVGWLNPTKYEFTKLNENINFLVEQGISPMVHVMFGPNRYEPDWLVTGNYTATRLEALMKDMIDKITASNGNATKVDVWNVLNEVFAWDGTYNPYGTAVSPSDQNVWLKMGWETDMSGLTGTDKINTQHPIFVRKVFEYFRTKTNKKLELRDYNIESNNASNPNNKKHKAFYQLVKHMKNSGIPIDAVGIQGHVNIGQVDYITANQDVKIAVSRLKALGVEVYIDELDIACAETNGQTLAYTDARKLQQKKDYYNYVKQAIEGGATVINTWGSYDNGEAGNWRVDQNPLLWDKQLNKKLAYDGVLQALIDTKR